MAATESQLQLARDLHNEITATQSQLKAIEERLKDKQSTLDGLKKAFQITESDLNPSAATKEKATPLASPPQSPATSATP